MVPEKARQFSANQFSERDTRSIPLEKHANHIVKTLVLALKSTVLVQPGHFVEHTN